MTTPEPSLSAPSNAPGISSTAEAVLAEAQAIAQADAAPAPAVDDATAPDVEPSMLAAMAEDGEDEADAPRKRNLSWNDAIKQVPPDIARLMKNMHGDYTRKTQELSAHRKDFLREREALTKGVDKLEVKELPEYDPFNEGTVHARIEAEVTRRLREVLEPMQQEYQVMQAEDSYKAFLSDHPDFQEDQPLRAEVQHLLESNEGLDLQTAYWAAKGKQAKLERETGKTKRAATRQATREAAKTGTATPRRASVGGKPDRSSMRGMSNVDLLELAKSMHRNK